MESSSEPSCDFVHIKENAKNVFFRCYDDYTTSLDLEDLLHDDVVLAYKLNGEDLPVPLGGPLTTCSAREICLQECTVGKRD